MRRYLLIRIYSDNLTALSGEQFNDALLSSVRKYFGEIGVSTIAPKLLRFDPHRFEAIVGCQKSREKELQAAVALIREIAGSSVAALTVRISGTIKSLVTS
jgi:RNase P/RNase MRP subunit POP5